MHSDNDDCITSKYKISTIEKELINDSFLRVHRSFIINVNKITAFTNHDIQVSKTEIPIGASYRDAVVLFLDTIEKD